jgi:uncharacterized protein
VTSRLTRISVRVQPRASKNEVVGFQDGAWKIRLTAPPVENAANEALIDLLSSVLGIPKRRISLVSGGKGRRKTMELTGLSEEETAQRLSASSK